nr:uncharacterized protein LOC116831187 isoform X3 [Chelonoidis abingdonii]
MELGNKLSLVRQGESTAAWGSLEGVPATAPNPQPGPEPPRAAEEDAECLSKPELEQDASEDGGSSLGSSSVALDPVEKEWLQGAASGHLLTLSHLLKQDPSLATRKDFTSGTALHWAAKHGQEDLASLLVAAGADVNSRSVLLSPSPRCSPCSDPARREYAGARGRTDGQTSQQALQDRLGSGHWATPRCTLLLCTGTARSWTCSSRATVPSKTCGITVGTWPDTTWEQRSRGTELPRCPICQRCAAGTGRWPVCPCPRAVARPGSAGALPRT